MTRISQIFNDFYSVRDELLQLPMGEWNQVIEDVKTHLKHPASRFHSSRHLKEFEKFTKCLSVDQLQLLMQEMKQTPGVFSFLHQSQAIERRLQEFHQHGYETGWESIPDAEEIEAFCQTLGYQSLELAFHHFLLTNAYGTVEVVYQVEKDQLLIQLMSHSLPYERLKGIGTVLQTVSRSKFEHNRCTRLKAALDEFHVSYSVSIAVPHPKKRQLSMQKNA